MNELVSIDRYEKQIQGAKGKCLEGALIIGKALLAIKEGNLYLSVGAKTFEHYAEQTHGISRSSAYNYIGVYKYFGPLLLADPSLQAVDPSRLIRLLPLIDETNKEDLLHMAASVPDEKGFSNNIRNRKGKVATDECDHPDGFDPVGYEVCRHCNLKRKVTG